MTWLMRLRPDTALYVQIFFALVHFLWQGVAVAGGVWLAEPWLRRCSAAFRYNVFIAALVVLALSPIANLVLITRGGSQPVTQVHATTGQGSGWSTRTFDGNDRSDKAGSGDLTSLQTAAAHVPEDPTRPVILERAAAWTVAAYAAGVMVMLARLIVAVLVGRSLSRATFDVPPKLRETFERIAGRLRLMRLPALRLCERVATPSVVGILRPVILLPVSAVAELPVSQLEAILAHELAHVRRLDVLANLFQRLVEVFLFFHPAVWFVSGRVRVERENCCVDVVLSMGTSPRAYAGALVRIAESSLPAPLSALGAVGTGSRLHRRVHRIIGVQVQDPVLPRGGIVVVMALAVIAVLAIGLGVNGRLARAQTPKTAPALQPGTSSGSGTPTERGLEWLAHRVGADGRIATTQPSAQSSVAIPAFAGLAFLASGSTSENGRYADQLKAIEKRVLARQDASGLIASKVEGPMYEHGYAMLFLAESQMKHPDAAVRQALVKAVGLTEKAVNSEGGWRYMPKPLDADISVTACQLNALLAAKAAGIDVSQKVIEGALAFVRKCQNPDGGFAYMAGQGGFGGSGWPRSAAGVAVLLHGGARVVDEDVVRGIRYSNNMLGDPSRRAKQGHYFYGTFYASQWVSSAARDRKGAEKMAAEILASQRPDGSWTDSVSNEYATANALIALLSRDGRLWMFK